VCALLFTCHFSGLTYRTLKSGLSIFAVTSFTILALTCAFLASVTVVLAFCALEFPFTASCILNTHMLDIVSILIFILIVTLFSSILLTGFLIAIYSFVRFVALVREHGREGIWIWFEDTNFFAFNHTSITSSHEHDGTEMPDVWFEKSLSGSAEVSDQEALGGLAVKVKHEDSSFSPSPNQTLVSEEVKVEGS
jgi:hypothetical protein